MSEKRLSNDVIDFVGDESDLDDLLHPAQAFDHPSDVVDDPDLTLNEKRAILASWASDACAVEAAPALRKTPGATRSVGFDDVMDALRTLDQQVKGNNSARQQRILRQKRFSYRPPERPDSDHSLN
jgi:hypothetical protein